jgi:hypothetical protein
MRLFNKTPKFIRQSKADDPIRLATVTAVQTDGYVSINFGSTALSEPAVAVKACSCKVGDRVVVTMHGTQLFVIGNTSAPGLELQQVYPVGSLYLNAYASTNPSTLLGFGTWEAFAPGRVLLGMGSNGTTSYNTLRATGGSESVTLTTTQMPSHKHRGYLPNFNAVATMDYSEGIILTGGNPWHNGSWQSYASDVAFGTTEKIPAASATGGDGSHENRMPYITVYIWRRTA